MNRFMRLLVMFDLPVTTAIERKNAAAFRKFLLKDGYYMIQFSVYVRICNGIDNAEMHKKRLQAAIPPDGSVRMMIITEKQYESMAILTGKLTQADESFQTEQLTVL